MANESNIYDGSPDARQGGEISVSRFRPTYRALSDEEKQFHDELKAKAAELEQMIDRIGAGRYQSLAMTSLEESIMWAVKELTGDGGLAK